MIFVFAVCVMCDRRLTSEERDDFSKRRKDFAREETSLLATLREIKRALTTDGADVQRLTNEQREIEKKLGELRKKGEAIVDEMMSKRNPDWKRKQSEMSKKRDEFLAQGKTAMEPQ